MTCATCEHWNKWDKAPVEQGECFRLQTGTLEDGDMPGPGLLLARGTRTHPLILTHATFGCTLHQPAPPPPAP